MKKSVGLLFLFMAISVFDLSSKIPSYEGKVIVTFKNPIIGSVVVKGIDLNPKTESTWEVILDSAKIIKGKYTFNYTNRNIRIASLVVYEKGSSIGKQLSFQNPYFDRPFYESNIILDNGISKINVVSNDKATFYSTIKGSLETDINFKLSKDRNQTHKYLDSNSGKILNYDIIRKYAYSEWLLANIYADRKLYNSYDSLQTMYDLFNEDIKHSSDGMRLYFYLYTLKREKLLLGKKIADSFLYNDTEGKKYNFNDFIQNKTLGLVVFWAGYCYNCKAEVPYLKKLYLKYQKDVAFVSLSVDYKIDGWKKSVERDKLDWLSLSGLPDSICQIREMYQINDIHFIMIVDNNSKILYCFELEGSYNEYTFASNIISDKLDSLLIQRR